MRSFGTGILAASARATRSPITWSASTGSPALMSRNIEAVIGEPSVVSKPLVRWKNGPVGAWPDAFAIALHSSSMPSRKSLPPATARMLPTEVRIRQVDAASDARKTHFSHMLHDVFAGHGAELA